MKTKLLIATCAAVLGLVAGWLLGGHGTNDPAPAEPEAKPSPTEPVNVAPPPRPGHISTETVERTKTEEKAKRVEIKLSTVYTTTDQPGLRWFPKAYDEFSRGQLNKVRATVGVLGVHDAFVVAAGDVYGAMYLTTAVLTDGLWGHRISLGRPGERSFADLPTMVWLFVNLEPQSNPRYWELASVELEGQQVHVTYRLTPVSLDWVGYSYAMSFPHAYWIPLPQLREGEYTISLRDEAKSIDTLVRRVSVVVP
jgi:hypothetical protein